jgi:hypothetical protein
VIEHLPSKHEALISNSSTSKTKTTTKKRKLLNYLGNNASIS